MSVVPGCCIALAALLLGLLLPQGAWGKEAAEERFIGWKGEVPQASGHGTQGSQPQRTTGATPHQQRWIETISWKPRAALQHGFLTPEECDHLVALAAKRVARSYVVDSATGTSKLDSVRTSYGATLGRAEDDVVARIEARIAEWTHLPASHGENIQVLKYVNGQKYDSHWDWFDDPIHHGHPEVSNRVATVLMYLSDVEEGGETTLPLADPLLPARWKLANQSACAAHAAPGIAIRPNKGDAILFWDMHLDGLTGDRAALHASCPTTGGTKWTATKWIHNRVYGSHFDPLKAGATCKDTRHHCKKLAAQGKCDTVPDLVGPLGTCRKSCGDCIPCPAGDILCMRGNVGGRRRSHKASLG